MKSTKTFVSDISKIEFLVKEKILGKEIQEPVLSLIVEEHPDFTAESVMAVRELNAYREKYISNYLLFENGAISELEASVLDSLIDETSLVAKVEDEPEIRTQGQILADNVASFGGSWRFIIIFTLFIVVWIIINVFFLLSNSFDPYPFILLNLILSCLAALQAPIIMMSQNRREQKDRERAKKDYMINLKSEVEITMLHEKIDLLVKNQKHKHQQMAEIQKVQIQMLNDILKQIQ